MDNNYEDIIFLIGLALRHAEHLIETGNRNNLATEDNNLLVLDSLDIIRSNIQGAVNGTQRNSIHLILYLYQHSLDNSQGKRQFNLEYRAFINLGFHIYMATQGLNLAADNIHANATAGYVSNGFSSGEAWQKNQANSISIWQSICILTANHALFYSLVANLVCIDAGAVICNHDDNIVALMTGNQANLTGTRLTLCFTVIRMLYTMIQGITEQMHQWIADFINNGTIQLCVLTLNGKVDILVQLLGQVTNHAREAVKYLAYRHHSYLHNYGLQISSYPIHLLQGLC